MRKLRHRDQSGMGGGGRGGVVCVWGGRDMSRDLHPDESLHSLRTCVCTNLWRSEQQAPRTQSPTGKSRRGRVSVRVTRSGAAGGPQGWGGSWQRRHRKTSPPPGLKRQADDVVALVPSKSQSREPGGPCVAPAGACRALGYVFAPWPSDQCPILLPPSPPARAPSLTPTGARTHRALGEWYRIWANPQRHAWLEP